MYTPAQGDKPSSAFFKLAVDGRGEQPTDWFPCTCLGPLADAVARYCGKGKQVHVEGRIATRSQQVTLADGSQAWTNDMRVRVGSCEFLADPKQQAQPAASPVAPSPMPVAAPAAQADDGMANLLAAIQTNPALLQAVAGVAAQTAAQTAAQNAAAPAQAPTAPPAHSDNERPF